MKRLFLLNHVWRHVYEGEAAKAAADKAAADKAAADKAAADKVAADKVAADKKTYTKEEYETAIAAEQAKHRGTVDQLKAFESKDKLTEKEREDLRKSIAEKEQELLTKQELARTEKDKIEKKHKTTVDELTADRDKWQKDYVELRISRAIRDAAVAHKAINPSQVVDLLRSRTSLKEDEESPTGDIVMMKLDTTDKEGKAVVLDLSVDTAIKQMTEMESHWNLFEVAGEGGSGRTNQRTAPPQGSIDWKKLSKDPEAYRKKRAEGHEPD